MQATGVRQEACGKFVPHIVGICAWARAPLALALFATSICSTDAMATEEISFAVVERQGQLEIRQYQPYVVAQTLVDGDFENVGNEGFRRLFRYISGFNRGSKSIAMTAPVVQESASEKIAMTAPVIQDKVENQWRIAFVMPAGYTLASTPQPLDPRVTLAEVPSRLVAAVRYTGTWTKSRYDEKLAVLNAFIQGHGLTAVGEPVFARYDPPFMPWFLRRNEILIPVRREGDAG
jgi:hypothetical protein